MEQTVPKIDRSVEDEIDDLIKRLDKIRSRLIDVHNELEALAEHRGLPTDRFYVMVGDYTVYPEALLAERIKEMIANTLLKEKGNLHDQYRVLTGTIAEGVMTNQGPGKLPEYMPGEEFQYYTGSKWRNCTESIYSKMINNNHHGRIMVNGKVTFKTEGAPQ